MFLKVVRFLRLICSKSDGVLEMQLSLFLEKVACQVPHSSMRQNILSFLSLVCMEFVFPFVDFQPVSVFRYNVSLL